VIVSTPPAAHFEHASAVLERGRHVFIEAPMALSVEHCDRLVAQASRSRVIATVGLNLRHHPMIQRAKRCVRDGWIGPVQAISSTFTTPSRGQRTDVFPAWRKPEVLDGSVFSECAVEFFDAWRDLTGAEIDEISVHCSSKGGPVSLSATMGGSIAVGAVFSEYSGDTSEMRLMGRDGTLGLSHYRFNGFDYCPPLVAHGSPRQILRRALESVRALPRGLRLASGGGEYAETFRTQLCSFVDAIRGGASPRISLEDGRAAAAATLAAFRSMEEGRAVALSEILGEAPAAGSSGPG
jgi:predicted dehydrogenase